MNASAVSPCHQLHNKGCSVQRPAPQAQLPCPLAPSCRRSTAASGPRVRSALAAAAFDRTIRSSRRPDASFTSRPYTAAPPRSCSSGSSSSWCHADRQSRRAGAAGPAAAANQAMSDQGPAQQKSLEEAAAQVQLFRAAFPELDGEVLRMLLSANPAVVSGPPAETRTKMEEISRLLACDLPTVGRLIAKVNAAWIRPPEALQAKLQALATELETPLPDVVSLINAQPVIWGINTASIVRDRLEPLAERMEVPLPTLVQLIAKQPMVWQIQPSQVKCSIPSASTQLGLSQVETLRLAAKMPVLLSLEPKLLLLGINGLASTMGVRLSQLLELVSKHLGLVAVPAEVLGSNLENLAAVLDVEVDLVLDLVIRQPTLLATQVANIANALDTLTSALGVSRPAALDILIRQPALAWDQSVQSIGSRLEALSTAFKVPVAEVKSLAQQQPALLVITTNTIRASVAAFDRDLGQPLAACLALLVKDPGTFVMLGYLGEVIDQWSQRLGLAPEVVSRLVTQQPALLEMSPTTVKVRLESLAALFDIPLEIAVQLVMKHPALATIPPNATITKAKSMSMALGCTMQSAATLMAKEAGVLCCCASPPGELNRDLKPFLDNIQEVVASYEYYTMEWIQRQVKEGSPTKMTSFAQMDTRPR